MEKAKREGGREGGKVKYMYLTEREGRRGREREKEEVGRRGGEEKAKREGGKVKYLNIVCISVYCLM